MNYQAFLSVISLIAAAYAFLTRQAKLGLGLLIYAVVFFLLIPEIAFGIKDDFVKALGLVLFVVGSIAIVYKKKEKAIDEPTKEQENA